MDGDSLSRVASLLVKKNYFHLFPLEVRTEIAHRLTLVELHSGKRTNYSQHDGNLYFPITSVFAMENSLPDGNSSLVRFMGSRFFVGIQPRTALNTLGYRVIEVARGGYALVMPLEAFWRLFAAIPRISEVSEVVYSVFTMVGLTNATCAASHSVSQRLMRTLLAAQDALPSSQDIALTHEKLAQYIHARRESVTDTLQDFSNAGIVSLGRTSVSLVDVEKCESVACGCYRLVRDFDDKVYEQAKTILCGTIR